MNIKFRIEDAENEAGAPDRNWSRISLFVDGKSIMAESPVFHLCATHGVHGFAGSCARAIRTNLRSYPGESGWACEIPLVEKLLEKLDGIEINYYQPVIEYQRSK